LPHTPEDLAVQIARIDETVSEIYHRLFGNGQPGELAALQQKQGEMKEFVSQAKGALWVIGGMLTLISGVIIVLVDKHF